MRIPVLSFFLLFFIINVSAQQLSYKQVDTTSFNLYENNNWLKLISFGESAIKEGFDFYYLDLRLAIAYFNEENYFKAEKYFHLANNKNPGSAIVTEYLYEINLLTGQNLLASRELKLLDDTVIMRLGENKHYKFKSIYIEGGLKFSSDLNIESNEVVGSLAFKQQLSAGIDLGAQFSYIGQHNAPWGHYNQFEVAIIPRFAIGRNTKIFFGGHYIYNKSNVDLKTDSTFHFSIPVTTIFGEGTLEIDSTFKTTSNSTIIRNTQAYFAGVEHNFGRANLNISGNLFLLKRNSQLATVDSISWDQRILFNDLLLGQTIGDTVIITSGPSDSLQTNFQLGIGANYLFPWLNNGVKIGLDVYLPVDDVSKTIFVPSIAIKILPNTWLFGDYIQKSNVPLLYHQGYNYLNKFYKIKHRIDLGLTYNYKNKIDFYFVGIYEDKDYFSIDINNQFYSFIFGINIKL